LSFLGYKEIEGEVKGAKEREKRLKKKKTGAKTKSTRAIYNRSISKIVEKGLRGKSTAERECKSSPPATREQKTVKSGLDRNRRHDKVGEGRERSGTEQKKPTEESLTKLITDRFREILA